MVLGKRTRERSSDSTNSGCFEILLNDKPISPSPLRAMHEDDVSGIAAMLRRRKQPKTTPRSSDTKMAWTKDDELIILGSIVDYEKETKLSYKSDWDAFYGYVKDFFEADFSRKQLIDKTRNLKKRFLGNKARCNDGEEPSFTNTEDDEVFKLSRIIWDTKNETECDSNKNMEQEAKDVPCVEHERFDENMDQEKVLDLDKDAPCVEHQRVNEKMDLEQEKDVPCEEHERVNEDMDQEEVVPYSEDELVIKASMETDKGEKEKSVDEFCALKDAQTDKEEKEKNKDEFCARKDALTDKEEKEKSEEDSALKDALEEVTALFQRTSKYQQKLMFQKLTSLGAERRKELADEWKALLEEEMKLCAKKLSLAAKLARSIADSC